MYADAPQHLDDGLDVAVVEHGFGELDVAKVAWALHLHPPHTHWRRRRGEQGARRVLLYHRRNTTASSLALATFGCTSIWRC